MRHVEAYSRLAGVYDEIVADPCHGQWASFLDELWSADPQGVGTVLDLCCGTGLLAGELIARGYRVVGVDASEAMLALARERLGPEVVLSRMTLPELTVDAGFDAVVCTLDGFNYLDSGRPAADDERGGRLPPARRLARLRPPHRRDDELHHRQPRRRGRVGRKRVRRSPAPWIAATRICDTTIELTRPRDGDPFSEQHRQYFHADADVRAALQDAGFEVTAVGEEYTHEPVDASSLRATWTARRAVVHDPEFRNRPGV